MVTLMLPPVDPGVLHRNPSLAILYKDLCTRKLNSDGSTRDTKKQRLHDEIRRNLIHARTRLAETSLLLSTLSDLPSRAPSLPTELHAVIELAVAQLHGHISVSDLDVLSDDLTFLYDNVQVVSTLISDQLTLVATHLCKIADPTRPLDIESLPSQADHVQDRATRGLPQELAEARMELANSAHQALSLHRQVLELGIRTLEQTMHGSLARGLRARAELLQSKAALLGAQTRIYSLTHPPPPEFLASMRNFQASQGSTGKSLLDREALAKRALELYDKAGTKAMADAAKRALFLRREIARVEDEIGKLKKGT